MWDPQDMANNCNNSTVNATTCMDMLLQSQDDILDFPNLAGTFSTPKPTSALFAASAAANGNNSSTSTTTSNGVMETPQPSPPQPQSQPQPMPVPVQHQQQQHALHQHKEYYGHLGQQQQDSTRNGQMTTISDQSTPNFGSYHSHSMPNVPPLSYGLQHGHTHSSSHHGHVPPPLPPAHVPSGEEMQSYGGSPPVPQHKCNHCGKLCRDFNHLSSHIRRAHPQLQTVQPDQQASSYSNHTSSTKSDTSSYNSRHSHPQQHEHQQQQSKSHHSRSHDKIVTGSTNSTSHNSTGYQQQQPPIPNRGYFCEVCKTSYGSSSHLKRHLGTVMHRNNLKDGGVSVSVSTSQRQAAHSSRSAIGLSSDHKPEFRCEVCNASLTEARGLRKHYLTIMHQNNVRKNGGGDDYESAAKMQKTRTNNSKQEPAPPHLQVQQSRQSQRQRQPPSRRFSPPLPTQQHAAAPGPSTSTSARPRPYKCSLCFVDFESQRNLNRHFTCKSHIAKTSNSVGTSDAAAAAAGLIYDFECENCAVSFPTSNDLEHHYLTAHLSLSQEEIGGGGGAGANGGIGLGSGSTARGGGSSRRSKELKCDACGFNFRDSYHLRRHFMSQSHQRKVEALRVIPEVVMEEEEDDHSVRPGGDGGGGNFHCETCGTSYKSARQIKRHYGTPTHKKNFAARNSGSNDGGSNYGSNGGGNGFTLDIDRRTQAARSFPSGPVLTVPTIAARTSITAATGSTDPKRKYRCEVCNTFYLTGSHLRRHYTTTSHRMMIESGGSASAVESRIATNSTAAPSRSKNQNQSSHVSVSVNESSAAAASRFCSLCGVKCSNVAALNMHMKKSHPETAQKVKLEHQQAGIPIEIHGSSSWYDSASTSVYGQDSTSKKIAPRMHCTVCNTSYRSNYDLQRHFRTILHRTNQENGGVSGAGDPYSHSSVPTARPAALVGMGHFLGDLAAPSPPAGRSNRPNSTYENSGTGKSRPKCKICNHVYSSNKELRKHYATKKHQDKLSELQARGIYPSTDDHDDDMYDFSSLIVQQNDHDAEMLTLPYNNNETRSRRSGGKSTTSRRNRRRLPCETCGTTYGGERDLKRHYLTVKHRHAVKVSGAAVVPPVAVPSTSSSYSASDSSPSKSIDADFSYKCNTCETFYFSADALEEHKKSEPHVTAAMRVENQGNGAGGAAAVGGGSGEGMEVDVEHD